MPFKSIKSLYGTICKLYEQGMSGSEISNKLGFNHSNSVRQILKKNGKLRTQSEAGKLAANQGKKDKAIALLIKSAKTDNRFNPLKSPGKKEDNPNWIKDRTKLKKKRNSTEEVYFFKEVMTERGFKCQLTLEKGKLSVHHISGVWSHPELRYEKQNCIVILKHIHLKFHKMYGQRSSKQDWDSFVKNEEFKDDYLLRVKKNYVPFEDKTNKRFGRLLVLKKVGKKWECTCDCGNTTYVYTGNLNSGKTKSCGCLQKELVTLRIVNGKMWLLSSRSNKRLLMK